MSCSLLEPLGRIQSIDRILNEYFIWDIAFESDGTAWMKAPDVGLIKYETDGSWELFDQTNSIINGTNYSIRDIVVDDQDRVWLGNDGLVCYDGEFIRYDSTNSVIRGDHINCLEVDSEGKVWFSISGDSGESELGCFNDGNITIYSPEHPGFFRRIGDMAIDQDDNIWCSSLSILQDTCLFKFDQAEWTAYDTSDFGFKPYQIDKIMVTPDNDLIGRISYLLSSSTVPDDAPHAFIYDGISFDVMDDDNLECLTSFIDSDGDIWGSRIGQLSVRRQDGIIRKPILYDPYFITESPSGDIWVSSKKGVYIYRKVN